MSISDIKYSLRKCDFPMCAKEALSKMEQLLAGRTTPSSKQMDMALDIASEFIFCEDRRGGRRGSGLNPLQELQLIDIVCEYLSSCTSETTKNTIFLSLFGGTDIQRQRLKILSILASMAVSASSTPVLLAVGVWLQQMGCSSRQSLQLVESIIQDHFFLNTSNQAALKSLAHTAPQFVANFITAVTELYMCEVDGVVKMPPRNLLEVITAWVYGNPALWLSASRAAALPFGAIPMAAVAPIAGLVHWCARAPLYLQDDIETIDITVPAKKIKLEIPDPTTTKANKPLSEAELYTKLHLGVLLSLRARRTPPAPPAVAAAPLAALAHAVLNRARAKPPSSERMQECLDRIGQAVQVALANGCVYGNINHLLASLQLLPENRLLQIVIKTHQQTM